MSDPVKAPAHYVRNGYELADVIDAWDLGRWETQCVQYIFRARFKGTENQDLRKARQFLDRAIEACEPDAVTVQPDDEVIEHTRDVGQCTLCNDPARWSVVGSTAVLCDAHRYGGVK